jgi:hypothetical protein
MQSTQRSRSPFACPPVLVLVVEDVDGADGDAGGAADALPRVDHFVHEEVDRAEAAAVELGSPGVRPLVWVLGLLQKPVVALAYAAGLRVRSRHGRRFAATPGECAVHGLRRALAFRDGK